MSKLEGKVAVITGGGRGIGRAIALRLAQEGAAIVVSSRTEAEIAEAVAQAKALGVNALAVVADAMQRSSAREPVVRALAEFGRVDILVNNVGGLIGMHHTFGDGSDAADDSFEATMVLNVTSAWWTSAQALPAMQKAGFGRIINIGSTESLLANPGCPPAYIAGKHAIAGLTRQLAQDVGDSGVTVNCICPGWTNTSMVDFDGMAEHTGMTPEQARSYAESMSAQNCILEPEDIAAMALFLASDEGARITGQVISVDGGYRL
ncbi:MAG: SDR family oxidoreductase [Novosphingobium sp.]|nr:SDR family oxidoreductase [Novosphingobium sp.]